VEGVIETATFVCSFPLAIPTCIAAAGRLLASTGHNIACINDQFVNKVSVPQIVRFLPKPTS
jgi:hypothetical protein